MTHSEHLHAGILHDPRCPECAANVQHRDGYRGQGRPVGSGAGIPRTDRGRKARRKGA
jgi:hypothetical protein